MEEHESVYSRIHRVLSWKRVVAFNILLLLVLVVPLSVRLAQEDTETRSEAQDEVAPSPTPPPNYPLEPPRIDRVVLFYGKPGDTVVLLGEHFGDYQWASRVSLGNVYVNEDAVLRWSDTSVEVEIPPSSRGGAVWIDVNGRRATWNGTLLLYDVAQSTKIGLTRLASPQVLLWVEQGDALSRGMIEFGYSLGQVSASAPDGVTIEEQAYTSDAYGNILRIQFLLDRPLARTRSTLLNLSKSVGSLDIVRAEFFDSSGQIMSVYSDPLSVSLTF